MGMIQAQVVVAIWGRPEQAPH